MTVEDPMNEQTSIEEEKRSTARELIAFAFVEEAYSKTGDLVSGLVPLFAPVLAKKPHRRFDPAEFAADVQRVYDIPMSPLVAAGLVEKLVEAKLLTQAEGEAHTYRIAPTPLTSTTFDEAEVDALLATFSQFANESLARFGLQQDPDSLATAFLQRLTSAQFLSFTDRREKNYYRGRTIALKRIEDDPQDAFQLNQALDVLSADFALRNLEHGGAAAELLARLMSGAIIAEVVLTLQTPSSSDALARLTVVSDGPLILDYLDLSTPELRDYANDLFQLLGRAGVRKAVFKHTVEEMKGTLRGPLEALQRGDQPFGPLGNRIRVDTSHAAYARETLSDLEGRVEKLGFEILDADAFLTPERIRYCDDAAEEGLRNNVGPVMENLERRIRDAHSIATVLRLREEAYKAKSVADARWVLVTRNEAVAKRSHGFLLVRKLMARDQVPPAITDRQLAGYLWFAVGGSLGALSRKKLVANCSNVMSPRTDVVSKVRQYLTELDSEKASLFVALMRDQRAQRCLVHATLAFPSAVTSDNAEQLLEEVRLSVAAEVREEAARREAQLKAEHDNAVAGLAKQHREEVLRRDADLLSAQSALKQHKKESEEKLGEHQREISQLKEHVHALASSVDADIDSRVQRAADDARRQTLALKVALVVGYLIIVGVAAWFTPGDRIYALVVTVLLALIGFWIVPQIAFEKLARPLWTKKFSARCADLGVSEHLHTYDADASTMQVVRKR